MDVMMRLLRCAWGAGGHPALLLGHDWLRCPTPFFFFLLGLLMFVAASPAHHRHIQSTPVCLPFLPVRLHTEPCCRILLAFLLYGQMCRALESVIRLCDPGAQLSDLVLLDPRRFLPLTQGILEREHFRTSRSAEVIVLLI